MATTPKKQESDAEVPVAEPTVNEYPLTLAEFCTRLSVDDRRVEMIGAFEHAERRANRVKDVESAYRARYAAFLNAPA